jgi:hypothetical protein
MLLIGFVEKGTFDLQKVICKISRVSEIEQSGQIFQLDSLWCPFVAPFLAL